MKRIAILAAIIFAGILCSCAKTDEPDYPYYNDYPPTWYDIEQLQDAYKTVIDLWETENQFSESLLCGKPWVFSKIYLETYVDGELSETLDYPFSTTSPVYFFNENHSMRINDSKGAWLYVKNRIIMRHDGSFYAYEVASVTQNTLILKREEAWFPETTVDYYIDKSGRHQFVVREFQAK
ncbi:MAG: hypothetical protein IKX11_01365 [Bacteroidales bacterium]|nr:hypothetical protein [Bacteroidales bacterium]